MADKTTDDPNKENPKAAESLDLFSSIMESSQQVDEESPEALPDSLAFSGISGEEPTQETEKPISRSGTEKPQLKAVENSQTPKKSADILDLASMAAKRSEGIGHSAEGQQVSGTVVNPAISDDTRAIAAAFREQAAGMPQVRGWDAGLVKFNPETRVLEPVDEQAAEKLAENQDLDIYVLSNLSQKWEPVHLEMRDGKPVIVPRPSEGIENQVVDPERLKAGNFRRFPTILPMEHVKLSSDASDRLKETLGQSSNEPDRGEDKKTNQEPPQMSAGAMLAAAAGQTLSSMLKSIMAAIAKIFAKLKEFASGIKDSAKNYVGNTLGNRGADTVPRMGNTATAAMAAASAQEQAQSSVDSLGADGVANRIKAQIDRTVDQIKEQGDQTIQDFNQAYKTSASKIHEGLGTNESGAGTIRSSDEFMQRFSARDDAHKAMVNEGVSGVKEAGSNLAGGILNLANDKRLEMIPAQRQKEVLQQFSEQLGKTPKQNALEAAAMEHAVNPAKPHESLKEGLANSQIVANEVLDQRISQAERQARAEEVHRAGLAVSQSNGQDQTIGTEGMTPRPA